MAKNLLFRCLFTKAVNNGFAESSLASLALLRIQKASTHFGYEQVNEDEKQKKVHTVFANVAKKYDLMNDAMSVGVHRLWKDYFVEQLNLHKDAEMVDVAGGTGDIAFRALNAMKKLPVGRGNVTLVDINQNMIDVGKVRAEENANVDMKRLNWVCANAETLPFPDNSFDFYTIAFGIRNCTHVDQVLREAFRVLKPNGKFCCLEFSRINGTLKPFYDLYSFQIIPVMGQILAGDYNSYKYLVESIRVFPDQEAFAKMIQEVGFQRVTMVGSSGGNLLNTLYRLCSHGSRKLVFKRPSSTSPPATNLVKIGVLLEENKIKTPYENKQLFLHKVFGYRGIILQSRKCKVKNVTKPKHEQKTSRSPISEQMPFYQALIHTDDLDEKRIPIGQTVILTECSTNREYEKVTNTYHAMDCVAHTEIMPYEVDDSMREEEQPLIKNPLYHNFFGHHHEEDFDFDDGHNSYTIISSHLDNGTYLAPDIENVTHMFPQEETTEGIEAQIMTFFLGAIQRNSTEYVWRYVIRVQNLEKIRPVTLLESNLEGVELDSQKSALQFFGVVHVPKGAHLWGKLKFNINGTPITTDLPNIQFKEPLGGESSKRTEQR
ncbi:ubiE/COQ5 methyltransferase family domain-containing protein [Ditylenchus destructor]|uniref:2-methoxy-6-polyprenyl-1,4-benzoquinol methylase, mitochondrial n=1 Tax=Ditylenchus destructor TaxID=166010 RepID=A0AAD4NIB4_9BILA|nr:ubiE/COQ5 methyltransferase family domain-containing protein [Ditylenchus destructor]